MMNTEAPGNPWDQEAASPQPEKPTRQPRQRRAPREAAAEPKVRKPRAAAPDAPKTPRKKKEKVERAAPETIKVTMKEYAIMRAGEDAKLFLKLHALLSAAAKGVRTKLLAELQKVFG